jgi:hypothetical protein
MNNIDNALMELGDDLAALAEPMTPDETLIDHYARRTFELDAAEVSITAKYEYMQNALRVAYESQLKDIDRRRAALNWKHGKAVELAVFDATNGRKQRHVKTPWGMVGFRRVPARHKLVVDDATLAVAACIESLPTAVLQPAPRLDNRQVLDALRRGERIAGVHLEREDEHDTFFCKTAAGDNPELPAEG